MPHSQRPKTYPFTLRLTAEQRCTLEEKAGRLPLGEYIRAKALDSETKSSYSRNRYPVKNQVIANQLLGELGRARIAENLFPFSEAAKLGTLVLTEDESTVLIQASADIAMMRRMLMQALGHRILANDH